jgi:hypothetical protein
MYGCLPCCLKKAVIRRIQIAKAGVHDVISDAEPAHTRPLVAGYYMFLPEGLRFTAARGPGHGGYRVTGWA